MRLVLDAQTGAVAQRIDYDAWGVVLQDSAPGFQPFGFAGGVTDADTGLVHFGAREYDPTTGTWLTRDPVLFDDGLSAYAYAQNDPVNRVDANGLWSFSISGYAGIGGGINVAYGPGVGMSIGYELGVGTPTGSAAKVEVFGKKLGGSVGVEWKEDLDCPGSFKDADATYNACVGPLCANQKSDVSAKESIDDPRLKSKKPFGAKAGVKMQMNVFRGALWD